MTPHTFTSLEARYTPGATISSATGGGGQGGVSWRRVAPVARRDTVQTFSLSRG